MKNKKYHTVGTVPKYHPVGTVPKYHAIGTVPKYHAVGTVITIPHCRNNYKNTTLSEQL
jgi:hypothetical protein